MPRQTPRTRVSAERLAQLRGQLDMLTRTLDSMITGIESRPAGWAIPVSALRGPIGETFLSVVGDCRRIRRLAQRLEDSGDD